MTLEQSLEQCLEKRMDGSCRSHPPVEDQLLLWTGKTYDPTTHQIKSRISDYHVTLKQGLVAKTGGAGTDKVTFTGFETTKATSFEMSIDIHNMGEQTAGIATRQVLWSNGDEYIALRDVDKQVIAVFDIKDAGQILSYAFTTIMATGANFNIKFAKEAGSNTVSCTITNLANLAETETQTETIGGGKDIATVTWTMLGARTADRPLRSGFSNEQITINGVCVANRPYCGDTKDICPTGSHGTINGTVSLAERSDYSTFRNDQYGFAIKSGVLYPKLLDGTGYAGLVGDPDAVYQGLIALKGGYDAQAQNYLKTKFSFTATDNTEIENAGLILDDYTALDCNDDLIYTADPYLAPLTYPNAFTAMTLANVSQQRYNNLADNNASRRIFIKYKKGTDVTDDGSRALITAGTVQEILVYKRDLTVAEAVKVLKYCNDFPMDNQVMVGNVPSVDGDDNFVFSCTGHTEPEIEIEEP